MHSFNSDTLNLVEMLGLISDPLDPVDVERRFFRFVDELFPFDRIALFFVKHGKGVLQGKLARGFEAQQLERMEISLKEQPLAELLAAGLPYCSQDGWLEGKLGRMEKLELWNFAFIPIVKRKNFPCWELWELEECSKAGCPAYGKNWLRCWYVTGTKCHVHGHASASREERECIRCIGCPVFANFETMEGLLLVDNSSSGDPLKEEMVKVLFVISQMVAVTLGNSKRFQKTQAAAIRDELTGLYNRRYFNERLFGELERGKRYGGAVSLISCDIDYFKFVNDTYGHLVGDRVLAWLGAFLRNRLRKSDVIARYGGEEFMILLMNTSKDQGWKTAENIRRHIAETEIAQDEIRLKITASFGVASLGGNGESVEDLLHKADMALYKAKLSGRNKVCMV